MKSKEEFFLDHIQHQLPIHGIIGGVQPFDESGKKRSEPMFYICDHNFNIIFSHTPYDNHGSFRKEVKAELDRLGIVGITDKFRTAHSIEDLIRTLYITASINHSCAVRNLNGKEEVEESSKEFENFQQIIDFCCNKINPMSPDDSIKFSYLSDRGKKDLKKASKWFKTNTSKTPIQDAWISYLKSKNIKVDWKACEIGCEDGCNIKRIDFSSEEELKRKSEENRKKVITPEVKRQLKKIAKNLK